MDRAWLLAADAGGTFTDCWARDPGGRELRCKLLSNGRMRAAVLSSSGNSAVLRDVWNAPDHTLIGFAAEAVEGNAREARKVTAHVAKAGEIHLELDGPLPDGTRTVDLFTGERSPVVGARLLTGTAPGKPFPILEYRVATTLATNALLEDKAARPVLFITAGFGDLLEIGDQRRPDLFALQHIKKGLPLAGTVEVHERLDASGNILTPLDEVALRAAALEKTATGARVAAVALAHSYLNPVHEKRVHAVLSEAGFSVISLSSDLAAMIKLLPRAQTAVVDAALCPVLDAFLQETAAPLGEGARVSFLTSNGALETPLTYHAKDSLLSGPAGGVGGCAAVAKSCGAPRVLTLDMGGTSTDVARWEGAFIYQFTQSVGAASILGTALQIETVAAGGGSICDVTHEGLCVGPRSAGADPGPACYGRGGPLTLTDVNLLLGRIDPAKAGIPLDPLPSQQRLDELRQKMHDWGFPPPAENSELLRGLLDIAVERMAEAVRTISVREGRNPADYPLVAFGGAGPQHACAIADRLGIREIFVPRHAGLLSAYGAGRARIERFASQQLFHLWTEASAEILSLTCQDLERQALNALLQAGTAGSINRRIAESRLAGQEATLALEFSRVEEIPALFACEYQRLYGYEPPSAKGIEIVALRVSAAEPEPASEMESFHNSFQDGPFTIQDAFSTLIVEPGWKARLGTRGTWHLERNAGAGCAGLASAPAVEAELFRCRFQGMVDNMGALLQRTAISTNVKERLDFSCALLDAEGRLVLNAPHVPVHLGAIGECARRCSAIIPPREGVLLVTNDPAFGGSHLPDVTVICPIFYQGELIGYAANRAHHAEIGGITPGSMPADARCLAEEGVVIPPMRLAVGDEFCEAELRKILTAGPGPTRAVEDNIADLRAQAAAARWGTQAIIALCDQHGAGTIIQHLRRMTHQSAAAMRHRMQEFPDHPLQAEESLDDGTPICVRLTKLGNGRLHVDFTGSGGVHPGSRNAPLAVVRSALLYVLRLWIGQAATLNEGLLEDVELTVPAGFLNPPFSEDPRLSPPVVAGNVETSQRVVDTLIKAFGLQACSQGTMNNVIFGSEEFGHYETICGGAGAGPGYHGADAVHTHMTNTAITDVEILERKFPVRLEKFALRPGSGGGGKFHGGCGIVRTYRFLQPAIVSLLTEHRICQPYGLHGGHPGSCGRQTLHTHDGNTKPLPGSATVSMQTGDVLVMETPGGGGWGTPS